MDSYNQGRSFSKGQLAVVVLVIALVAVGAGIYIRSLKHGEKITPLDEGRTLTSAQAGQMVSSFPVDLMLEPGATILQSYDMGRGGTKQPMIVYVSNRSLADNVAAYKTYLSGNGWHILQDGSASTPAFLYAVKDQYVEEANVLFGLQDGKTKVTISVLERTQTPSNNL
jgi:hypothetical protein